MNAKRYNIATLADMAAIPESARGRFLAALPAQWRVGQGRR
jgi:hypothetical protein